jgi:hypothetical protein
MELTPNLSNPRWERQEDTENEQEYNSHEGNRFVSGRKFKGKFIMIAFPPLRLERYL